MGAMDTRCPLSDQASLALRPPPSLPPQTHPLPRSRGRVGVGAMDTPVSVVGPGIAGASPPSQPPPAGGGRSTYGAARGEEYGVAGGRKCAASQAGKEFHPLPTSARKLTPSPVHGGGSGWGQWIPGARCRTRHRWRFAPLPASSRKLTPSPVHGGGSGWGQDTPVSVVGPGIAGASPPLPASPRRRGRCSAPSPAQLSGPGRPVQSRPWPITWWD